MTYYVVFQVHTRWLKRTTLCSILIELKNGKIKTTEDYANLHSTILKESRRVLGKNRAWGVVILNWVALPGAD